VRFEVSTLSERKLAIDVEREVLRGRVPPGRPELAQAFDHLGCELHPK
jgi:hypothetical protein